MVSQRISGVKTLVLGLPFLIGSCKDMGDEVPSPPPAPVTAGQSSFNLVPGTTASTKLSGGTPPYSFVSRGDENVVIPSIISDSLRLQAIGLGGSMIVVGDNGSPRLTVALTITVTELAAGQNVFNLFVNDSASTSIAGGTKPYTIVSNSDPSKASGTIVDTTLKIHAIDAGNTTLIVGDSHIPQRRDTVTVMVSSLISFSTQIQPIFTASCVNSGCHPGSGSPFPLLAGISRANLVGVDATTGSCRPIKRVQAGNANASALIRRLEGTCDSQMPLGSAPLSAAQIQLMRDWINQGALNN